MKIVETENTYGPLGCLHRTTAVFITAVIHLSPVEKIGGCDQGTASQSRRALQLPGRWVPSLLLLSLPAAVSCQGEFQQIRSSWAGWLLRAGVCHPVGCSQASDAPPPLLPTTPALSPQPASVFPTQEKLRISLRVPRTPPPPAPELVGSTFTSRPGGSGATPPTRDRPGVCDGQWAPCGGHGLPKLRPQLIPPVRSATGRAQGLRGDGGTSLVAAEVKA